MNKIKNYWRSFLTIGLFFCTVSSMAQTGFNKNYHFLHSDNLVAEKNFYLLTVLEHSPGVKQIIESDAYFKQLFSGRLALLKSHATDTCSQPLSLVGGFKYSREDSLQLAENMRSLYKSHQTAFDLVVNNHLRPSGYYQRFAGLSNEELFLKAWGQYIYER